MLRKILRGVAWILGIAVALAFLYFAYTTDPNIAYALVAAAFLAIIPAAIGQSKGGSFGAWWWFGFLLFIIALPCALLTKSDRGVVEERQIQGGEAKRCPYCFNLIHPQATICQYCHQWVEQPPQQPQ